MKYPSDVSITCPLFTAQIKTPQLIEIKIDAEKSNKIFRLSFKADLTSTIKFLK